MPGFFQRRVGWRSINGTNLLRGYTVSHRTSMRCAENWELIPHSTERYVNGKSRLPAMSGRAAYPPRQLQLVLWGNNIFLGTDTVGIEYRSRPIVVT